MPVNMLKSRVVLTCLALIAAILISFSSSAIPTTLARPVLAVPSGFTDTLVTAIANPTALAFTPDGRILITTQTGALRVFQNGALLGTPALSLTSRLCSDFERGLLGVTVDPAFATNNRIYVYYTFNKFNSCARNTSSSPVNRVSRFTLPAGNVIDPASEVVLVDNIASPNGNHNAGDVQFGRDGFLYISAGDGGCQLTNTSACGGSNQNARRQDILNGKILRVDTSGVPPASNPWAGMSGSRRCGDPAGVPAGSGPCRETFAWGLRNPFRMGFDPNAANTRFFINDVGELTWEEIDSATAGADYGWNTREGNCATGSTTNCGAPPAGMTNPIFAYGRTSGCRSISGGAFVPNGIWPASFTGAYLYSDFACGTIFALTPNGSGGFTSTSFATALGSSSAVHLQFGPDGAGQALYYTTYASGGQVRRIASTSTTPTNTPTPTRTNTPTATRTPIGPTNTPTRTPIGPTNTPTRTATPTNTPIGPTNTPTRTATPGTGACSPVTSTITAPFTFDGAGTFCWQSSNLGSFVNSWNLQRLTINGVDFTNRWAASSSYPPQINGFWYVSYQGSFPWSHFEAR